MNLALLKYGSVSDEIRDGRHIEWPYLVIELDDGGTVPSEGAWIAMTDIDYAAHIALYIDFYNAWRASRIIEDEIPEEGEE